MKPVPLLTIVVGVLLLLAGVVFILQGMGIVGPESSFMYNNPTWIYQGTAAAIIGLVIVLAGVFLSRRRGSVGSAA